MVQDEPPERSPGRRAEIPPQMGQAPPADADPPGKTGKPGKLIGGGAYGRTPLCGTETADRKHDSGRVGKGVLEGAGHGCLFLFPGDGEEAFPAENEAFFRFFRQRAAFGRRFVAFFGSRRCF